MPRPKGWRKRYENELVRYLWSLGFVAVRTPNSGVASLPYLDIFAWCPKNGELFAIELKTTSRESPEPDYILRMLSPSEEDAVKKLLEKGVSVLLVVRVRGGKYIPYSASVGDGGRITIERLQHPITDLCRSSRTPQ